MRRWPPFRRLALAAAPAAAVALACGNLIIPTNANDGGDPPDGSDDALDGALPAPNCDAGADPAALACTGLYSDWSHLILAPDVQPYQPGSTMWADGAASSRWIWLPAGSKITTTDVGNWVFPVGTKIWQEFRLLGARIETRFLWKVSGGFWFRATYAWNALETAAPQATAGIPNAHGLPYEIPPVSRCEQCHNGAADFVLGFEIVGLSMPQATGLNLTALKQKAMLSNPPASTPTIPGDSSTSTVLAYLHANCGTSCHNRSVDATAAETSLFLKLTVDTSGALPAAATQTDMWSTSYDVPSHFTPNGYDAGGFWRIKPGDLPHSMIPWRMSRRDGMSQMPPIDTHLVDSYGVLILDNWVSGLPGP
jgi:hypothetical protein